MKTELGRVVWLPVVQRTITKLIICICNVTLVSLMELVANMRTFREHEKGCADVPYRRA